MRVNNASLTSFDVNSVSVRGGDGNCTDFKQMFRGD